MSQVEWQIVKDVFYNALNHPPAERSDFLDSVCGINAPLRSEVEFLLESYESGFLESPVLADKNHKEKPAEPLFTHGREFGHYQILKMLGRGGMGEVYLANDTKLERLAAIKVIHGNSGFGDQSAERLVREARSAARLDHPNICSVYEVGETDGHAYIAMQYVEGEMLDALLERDTISFDDAVLYARQVAAGLSKAHSRGIVHRDIKPSNIIVGPEDQLKILDFGLAKETFLNSGDTDLSIVGLIAGTVSYMSPEHARGQTVDGRTDIWSLGVVFYQMLTGRLPFRGETKADLLSAILNEEIADPGDVPHAAKYILGRALQKDVSHRYASIGQFDADLAELATTGSVRKAVGFVSATTIPNTVSTPAALSRGYLIRYALPALLLLILIGGGYGFLRYRGAIIPARPFSANGIAGMAISSIYDLKREVNGVIMDLSISPDGTMLAFTVGVGREHVIYVKPIAGGDPMSLTEHAAINFSPVWSPDGKRIAYLSSGGHVNTIRSVSLLGGPSEVLIEMPMYDPLTELKKWSNDGRRIFFKRRLGPEQIDLETGIVSPVDITGIEGGSTNEFAISPDESRILMLSSSAKKRQLWVKSLGSSDARPIADGADVNSSLAWFADNRRYAYASSQSGSNQIYVGSIDGPPQQITNGPVSSTDPYVSPDGDHIFYIAASNEANIFLTDIASRKETTITSKTQMQVLPSISPDGLKIAYETLSDASSLTSGILKVESLGHSQSGLAINSAPIGSLPIWLASGGEVAYIRRFESGFNIWKFGLSDQKETQITRGGINPSPFTVSPVDFEYRPFDLSPDGRQVAFFSKSSGIDNLWVAATDGTGETKLTDLRDGATNASNPQWSPNGDRIAFVETIEGSNDRNYELFRIAIYNNGRITTVGEFNERTTLQGWSKDGTGVFVAVRGDNYNDMYFFQADGHGSMRKVRLPNDGGWGICISPDRQWVAYSDRRDETDNIYIASLEGGEPVRVTTNSDTKMYYSGVTWSDDSKTLLYSKQTGGVQISMISNTQ